MARSGISDRAFSRLQGGMTNSIALVLGLLILAALGVDLLLHGTEHLVFLGKKLFDLIDWVAFWR
jgi:hypothetical protein